MNRVIARTILVCTFAAPASASAQIPTTGRTQLPDASLGSRFTFYDVYAVIVYLIDAQGHFTRLEDGDTFQ